MASRVVQNLRQVSRTLRRDSNELSTYNGKNVSKYRFNKIKTDFLTTNYQTIYLNNLATALEMNPEFADESGMYSTPLVRLIDNPSLLKFNFNLQTVSLQMTELGGTLDNWAMAVNAAREETSHSTPTKASKYWQMMYKAAREGWEYKGKNVPKKFKDLSVKQLTHYQDLATKNSKGGFYRRQYIHQLAAKNRTQQLAQLYWEIIRTRIGTLAEGSCPWWYILNFGIYQIAMSSSYGGKAYPVAHATHFVEKTETQYTKIFRDMLKGKTTTGNKTVTPIDAHAVGEDLRNAVMGMPPVHVTYIRPEFKTKLVFKSQESGKFVSVDYAEANPGEVVPMEVPARG